MSSPSKLHRFAVPAVALGFAVSALACGEPEEKKQGGAVDTTVTTTAPAATSAPSTTVTTAAATTTTTAKPVTTTTTRPVTTTTAATSVSFSSCAKANAAGYHDMRRGEPGYSSNLDRDDDGIACDS